MRTIINQALTQKAQDLLLELNSEGVVALNILKAIIASFTARSVHYKQDKEKLKEFKKNSNRNKRKKSK